MPPFSSATPSTTLRGSNQSGLRAHHERLVLSLIRLHKQLHKAELVRLSGLSMQTISIIVNQLTAEELLLKGQRQRGRVGQPSAPYSLNPEGALSFGLKIGRRSVDLYLIDFVGKILALRHEATMVIPLAETRTATASSLVPPVRPPRIHWQRLGIWY